jgi:hypothetical protein
MFIFAWFNFAIAAFSALASMKIDNFVFWATLCAINIVSAGLNWKQFNAVKS